MWDGADVWIIGGGPSIPVQFGIPEKVIKSVVEGHSPPSIYSPYMEYLHNKHVIGINMAYHIGTWMDIIMFGDNGFFLREEQGLAAYPGLKVSCAPNSRSEPWVKYVERDLEHPKGISEHPDKVSWNNNTGAAAISLAVHTGAKRIMLLGFDMKLNKNNNQHWHDLYKKGPLLKQDQRRARKLPFDRHLSGFPVIQQDAKRMKVEILNVCPDSDIMCLPKYTLKELIYDNS
jgi:hypothetical protein